MNTVTSRMPASRNGRLAVGLVALCLGASLAACGGSTKTPAEAPRAAVRTDEPATVTTEAPAATDAPTEEPTIAATEAPTEAPTDVPATAAPAQPPTPTDVPPPTAEPPTAGPPTEVPPPRPDINPDGDRDCKDFANRQEAQAWWDYWHAKGHPNPGHLDGGKGNGIVCERY